MSRKRGGRDRTGFMIYSDEFKPYLERLDDAQLGALIRAALLYLETGAPPSFDDEVVWIAFSVLLARLDRARERARERAEGGEA